MNANKNYMIELDNAITKKHTGKMYAMQSLSTSCLCNEHCAKRQAANNTICAKCYAKRELARKKTLREKMQRNTELLTKHDFAPNEIPYINSSVFRFESFGELKNTLQVKNYFAICEKNPHCTFALWSKNMWLIDDAMNEYSINKPGNLIIIASVDTVDNPYFADDADAKDNFMYSFIDKVFAVYTKKYADENGIKINCGTRKCIECMRCYDKNNKDFVVRELMK